MKWFDRLFWYAVYALFASGTLTCLGVLLNVGPIIWISMGVFINCAAIMGLRCLASLLGR